MTEVPAQSLCQRQLPADPFAQEALVQHLIPAGSQGQAPSMVMPPAEEHNEVERHTPARPPEPTQGSLVAAEAREAARRGMRAVICILAADVVWIIDLWLDERGEMGSEIRGERGTYILEWEALSS